tara:strand:- start:4906 stop:5193 length:288 start_codon:yes stop_codon:yes gene_type:complete
MGDISDKSKLTFTLPYLIQIITAIGALTYTYVTLTDKVDYLENQVAIMQEDIKANSQWQREWESGGILPLDVEQNEKLKYLEWEVIKLHKQIYGN